MLLEYKKVYQFLSDPFLDGRLNLPETVDDVRIDYESVRDEFEVLAHKNFTDILGHSKCLDLLSSLNTSLSELEDLRIISENSLLIHADPEEI